MLFVRAHCAQQQVEVWQIMQRLSEYMAKDELLSEVAEVTYSYLVHLFTATLSSPVVTDVWSAEAEKIAEHQVAALLDTELVRMTRNLCSWGVMPTPFHEFPEVYLLPLSEQIKMDLQRLNFWLVRHAKGELGAYGPVQCSTHGGNLVNFPHEVPMPPRVTVARQHSPLQLSEPTPNMWHRPYHKDLRVWFRFMSNNQHFRDRSHNWTRWMEFPFVSFPLQFTGHHMRLLPPYQTFKFSRMLPCQALDERQRSFMGQTYIGLLMSLSVDAQRVEGIHGCTPVYHTDNMHPCHRHQPRVDLSLVDNAWRRQYSKHMDRLHPEQYYPGVIKDYQECVTYLDHNGAALKAALTEAWSHIYRLQKVVSGGMEAQIMEVDVPDGSVTPLPGWFMSYRPWRGPAHDGQLDFIVDRDRPSLVRDVRATVLLGQAPFRRLVKVQRSPMGFVLRHGYDGIRPVYQQDFHIEDVVPAEDVERDLDEFLADVRRRASQRH